MTVKDRLHRLVDLLPEPELHAAESYLAFLHAQHDPLLRALLSAPADDEPYTDAERAAVAEAWADVRAGRAVSDEELRRELGL